MSQYISTLSKLQMHRISDKRNIALWTNPYLFENILDWIGILLMPTSPTSSGKVLLKQNQKSDSTVAVSVYRMRSWCMNPYQETIGFGEDCCHCFNFLDQKYCGGWVENSNGIQFDLTLKTIKRYGYMEPQTLQRTTLQQHTDTQTTEQPTRL